MYKKIIMIFSIVCIVIIVILAKQKYDSSDLSRLVKIIKSDGAVNQVKIDNHMKIGEEVKFAQPYVAIVRKVDAIVPIVAKIKNELGGLHPITKSESRNIYMLHNRVLTISEVYSYSDIMNSPREYYVLIDENGSKYILSKFSLDRLTKPIYLDAIAPLEIFDELYLTNESINIKFFTVNTRNDKLIKSIFLDCNVEIFTINKWKIEAVAKVNFKQLSCLYQYFWDDFHSERQPVNFKIL